jgi:hypothetical protein
VKVFAGQPRHGVAHQSIHPGFLVLQKRSSYLATQYYITAKVSLIVR